MSEKLSETLRGLVSGQWTWLAEQVAAMEARAEKAERAFVECECGEFVKYPNPVSLCPECGNRFLWEAGMITHDGWPVIGCDRVGGGRRGEKARAEKAEARLAALDKLYEVRRPRSELVGHTYEDAAGCLDGSFRGDKFSDLADAIIEQQREVPQ